MVIFFSFLLLMSNFLCNFAAQKGNIKIYINNYLTVVPDTY